jgi:hypothetical protein
MEFNRSNKKSTYTNKQIMEKEMKRDLKNNKNNNNNIKKYFKTEADEEVKDQKKHSFDDLSSVDSYDDE